MARQISERQRKILDFVNAHIERSGYPPSMREIGRAVGISSTSVVTYNLTRLEEAGLLRRDREVSRGLRVPGAGQRQWSPQPVVRVPLLGRIVAGAPIPVPGSDFRIMGDEAVELTRDLLGDPEGLYALQVQGDSMIDALIYDGDIVIMRYQASVENGEMAAVWLREMEEVTLKRFYQEPGGQVRLQPANPTLTPLYFEPRQVEVQGKVMMVIRQLQ